MDIQTSRILGGVGACLTVIGAASGVFSLIHFAYPESAAANLAVTLVSGVVGTFSLIGFILFFIAMYGFSKVYAENKIFSYILWGIIFTIVATVIAGIIFFALILSNLSSIIPTLSPPFTSQTQITTMILTFLAPFFAVIGFVSLINVVFNVKAFYLLAEKSTVSMFKTASKVMLAGSSLTILIGIVFAVLASSGSVSLSTLLVVAVPGGLVQDMAWVLLAVAFFRINPSPNHPFISDTGQVKYCAKCGTSNLPDATYCKNCGQKF